jgi:pimeloyl-ACP methyl ester carboxylesterase
MDRSIVMKKQNLHIAAGAALILLFLFSVCQAQDELHDTYPPLPEAVSAMEPDFRMSVTTKEVAEWGEEENFYYAFKPALKDPSVGFIIYPGALVDPIAYAPTARAIAQQGYLVIIVKMPQDLAILGWARAQDVIRDNPGITKWVIGGHSLGGSSACAYARNYSDTLQGVVLWASWPSEGFRINDKPLKAISIYGSKDGAPDDIRDGAKDLPEGTPFVEIMGGNHTQFGYYWDGVNENFVQPGDNPADISRAEQQKQIVKATADFLAQFKENTCPATYLLGAGDARLGTLRQFRDTMLVNSTAGRALTALYYDTGAAVTAVFQQQPLLRIFARKALDITIPIVSFLMDH